MNRIVEPMADIVVQFLGSGDAFGSGGRFQACILVNGPSGRVLIDCGASSLVAMRRWGVEPNSIDAILVSHLHGDHFGGIPFFVLDAQLVSRRARPLWVYGPPGIEERVCAAMEVFFPGSSIIQRAFETRYVALQPEHPTPIGAGMAVTAYEVTHPSGAPAYALRVAAGDKIVAYSGDTQWTPNLAVVARGSDLFICEAYSFTKPIRYHLSYATVLKHRSELVCSRLVLTHLSEDMLMRREELHVAVAEDGQRMIV